MKALVSTILVVIPLSSFGALANLAKDFLANNADVLVAKSQVTLSQLDKDSVSLLKNTDLSFSSLYSDNSQEAFSAFGASIGAAATFRLPIKTTSNSLTLSKDFQWGGSLSLSNNHNIYELSNGQSIYGFNQSLTYTQNIGADFFGYSFRKQMAAAEHNIERAENQAEDTIQSQLLQLVNNYYQAARQKALVKLQKEARVRAERRLNLVSKRVKDGLREKVDRIQAEISFFQSKESVASAEQNLTSALESLATNVHRQVLLKEINDLGEDQQGMKNLPVGEIKDNKRLGALRGQISSNKANWEKSELAILPTVQLIAGVSNNDLDTKSGEVFSKGRVWGSTSQESKVGLNLSWAWGSKPANVEKTKALVQLKTTEMQAEKMELDLEQTKKAYQDQIALLGKNVDSAKGRIRLARQALEEYNKLYNRGRADLDQVIQAEETLINTEINLVQYQAQREQLIYALSFLYGSLDQFVLQGES